MRIAAAAYPIDWHESWNSYEAKLTGWVEDAARNGAELLVFPEYGAMELASLAGEARAADLEESQRAVSERLDDMNGLLCALAVRHGCYILSPSGPYFPGAASGTRPVNRAVFHGPDGSSAPQDKQIMTRYEREEMDIRPGGPLTVFDTPLGRIGTLICYDSEFPLLGRALVEHGVELLLVPSATEGLSGYWRVRIGAMARALEGQCVVVHAPTVGAAPWTPVVDMNRGAAAVYGPPDTGFPDTGVIAEGGLDSPGWVHADISLDTVRAVRRDGHVLNKTHWAEQPSRGEAVTIAWIGPKTP